MLPLLFVAFSRIALSQNTALRFLFKRMTPDCNWPVLPHNPKTLEGCRYFDPSIVFPDYYLKDFHAYDGGNLNPAAAKEALSATSAVMTHHFENLSGEECSHYVRRAYSVMTRGRDVDNMEDAMFAKRTLSKKRTIVDFGCGIGVSTKYLRDAFENDQVIGFDLSPYFLEETTGLGLPETDFVHCNIEDTSIDPGSVDVVSISYVLHELPYDVSVRVFREALRILKPGTGVLSVLDMHSPEPSSLIMKYIFNRTEPYLEEYSRLVRTMSSTLESVGFEDVQTSTMFPKTIVVLATKK